MKMYLKVMLSLAIFVLSYGLLVPFLVSFKDTFLVIVGILIMVLTPCLLYYVNKDVINYLKGE